MTGGTWPPKVLAARYELGRLLGQGGMGSVWQAADLTLKRTVAVKLVQLSAQSDVTAQARFAREAQAVAGLTHPNVVTVHDFGVDDGIAYMVMEFLPGPDLATLLRTGGALPVDDALRFLEEAAAGLGAAHLRGVLHRDVKPANLMLSGTGTLKVVDFGIAAVADRSHNLTATGNLIGTLSYLAPERSMGSPASVQSDLYAFGCVAVTLLSGKPPFEGTTGQIVLRHLNEPPPRLTALRSDLPDGLDAMIASLLAKDPSERPRTAEEVVERLRRIRTQRGPAHPATVAGLAAMSTLGPYQGWQGETVGQADRTRVHPAPGDGAGPASATEESATVLRENPAPEAAFEWARAAAPPVHRDTRRQTPPTPPAPVPPADGRRRKRWLFTAGITAAAVLIITILVARGQGQPGVAAAQAPATSSSAEATTSTQTGPLSPRSSAIPSETGPGADGSAPGLRVVSRFAAAPKAVGIALDSSRGRLYVASFGEGALVVLDAVSGKRIAKIPVGRGAAGLAFDATRNAVYVQNATARSVATVDVDGLSPVGIVAAGDGQGRIAVDPVSHRVFTVNERRQAIQIVDPDALGIVGEIPLGVTPRSLAFDPATDRLYVVSAEAGTVLVIDPSSSTVVQRVAVGDTPVFVAVDSGGGHLLVALEASSEVAILDLRSLEPVTRFPVGNGPLGVAVDPGQRVAYVANTKDDSLSVLDLEKGQTTSTITGVGDGPEMVAVDEESHQVYVTSWYSGAVAVLERG